MRGVGVCTLLETTKMLGSQRYLIKDVNSVLRTPSVLRASGKRLDLNEE